MTELDISFHTSKKQKAFIFLDTQLYFLIKPQTKQCKPTASQDTPDVDDLFLNHSDNNFFTHKKHRSHPISAVSHLHKWGYRSWLCEVHLPVPSSAPSMHELQGWCVRDTFDDCVYIAYVVTLAFPVTFDLLHINHGTGQYLHIRNVW